MEQLSLFESDRTQRQIQCVNNWVQHKCVGTCCCPTGFGKTRIGLLAIKRFLSKNPSKVVIVIVPSDAIKIQWMKELEKNKLNAEVKTYYDTSRHNYKCDLLVLDEIHKVAAKTLYSTFDNVEYRIILGLTATFERLDGRDQLISRYCPIVDEVSVSEAIAKGWLADYREYLILINPDDIDEYRRLNSEFLQHFAFFDHNFPLAMSLSTDWKARISYCKEHNLSKDQSREVLIHAMGFNRTLQARKHYINTHPRKIELADMILEHRQDKKCITFSSTIAMAEKIKYGKVYSSKESNKKNRITLDEFINLDKGVLNTSMKLNEGFNDPTISVGIILGTNSSKTTKTQRLGRIIREHGGKVSEVFNLIIRGTVEEQWFKNSVGNDNYITVSEDNLLDLLEGREFSKKKNKQTNMLFRF